MRPSPACHGTPVPSRVLPEVWHPVGPQHMSAVVQELAVSSGGSPVSSGPANPRRLGRARLLGSSDGHTGVGSGRPGGPGERRLPHSPGRRGWEAVPPPFCPALPRRGPEVGRARPSL